jgi:suppressor of G2 allele of SKP1
MLSTKIEVVLRKKQAGQKWNSLEGFAPSGGDAVKAEPSAAPPTAPAPVATAPVYPTSSKKGVKDWDKLAASLSEKKKQKNKKADSEDKDADEGGDIDSDLEEYSGDPVDAFFKKLYSDADPDTRRAMMKSYVESQGTALSTNWSQVGKGKVEPHPPSDD